MTWHDVPPYGGKSSKSKGDWKDPRIDDWLEPHQALIEAKKRLPRSKHGYVAALRALAQKCMLHRKRKLRRASIKRFRERTRASKS
ncbi:MAG: hypothetical protein V4644_00440 [Patescibacteria group bacterium]